MVQQRQKCSKEKKKKKHKNAGSEIDYDQEIKKWQQQSDAKRKPGSV